MIKFVQPSVSSAYCAKRKVGAPEWEKNDEKTIKEEKKVNSFIKFTQIDKRPDKT